MSRKDAGQHGLEWSCRGEGGAGVRGSVRLRVMGRVTHWAGIGVSIGVVQVWGWNSSWG